MTLRGSFDVVVRDITDISHATTISALDPFTVAQFVSGTEISYADNLSLVCAPLSGSPKTRVPTKQGFVDSFAWSPDGGSVAYVTQSSSGMALHQLRSSQDQVFAGSMPVQPGVGCETQFCSLTDSSDFGLSYSPDGTTIALVDSILNVNVFRLWSSDGKVLNTSDSQSRAMTAWSGGSLYFRDPKGVEVWRGGVISLLLPGVAWIRPKASPAGGRIVYSIRDAQGWHHVYLLDIASKQVRELKTARSAPAFLTSRYIWYQGERSCVAADSCPPGWSVVGSGKTYIYDLQNGTETESIITSVANIWPPAA